MDQKSQERLNAILAKDIGSMTETDKSFLRARKTYIPNKKQKELRAVLGGSDPVVEPQPEVKRADWSEHPADTEEQTDSVTNEIDDEDDEAEG